MVKRKCTKICLLWIFRFALNISPPCLSLIQSYSYQQFNTAASLIFYQEKWRAGLYKKKGQSTQKAHKRWAFSSQCKRGRKCQDQVKRTIFISDLCNLRAQIFLHQVINLFLLTVSSINSLGLVHSCPTTLFYTVQFLSYQQSNRWNFSYALHSLYISF